MIVVDSSVWIGHLRNLITPPVLKLRSLRRDEAVLVGDLILLEVLQGARDDPHSALLEGILRRLEIVTLADDRLVVMAARNRRTLRSFGISSRETVNLIIGTFCIEHGHELLHDDRDFEPMHEHLGLRRA